MTRGNVGNKPMYNSNKKLYNWEPAGPTTKADNYRADTAEKPLRRAVRHLICVEKENIMQTHSRMKRLQQRQTEALTRPETQNVKYTPHCTKASL